MLMRTKSISVSERSLMFVIGGQLFDQAPNRQPRKASVIMQKVRDAFRSICYNDNEWYVAEIPEGDVYFNTYNFIKDLLMGIPEFVELNLSQVEFEKNISVDDENRSKYSFTSKYDKETAESWKSDFIDLDAFINNAHGRLLLLMKSDQDCFCCKYSNQGHLGDTETCNTCTVNPNLKCNYDGEREPKGKYTFACKYDCREHKYICCEECSKRDNCIGLCDGKSETCGNKVNPLTGITIEEDIKHPIYISTLGRAHCSICNAYICGYGQIEHCKVKCCPNCGKPLNLKNIKEENKNV